MRGYIYFLIAILIDVPVGYSKRQLPSYVKTCNRYDPDLDECIRSSILSLRPHLRHGITDMKLPPFDPLHIIELTVKNPNVKFITKGMDMAIFDQFDLRKVHFNWKECYVMLETVHPVIMIETSITANGIFIGIPLNGVSGSVDANLTNFHMKPETHCNITWRNGKEYLNFLDMNLGLNIGNAYIDFRLLPNKEQNDNLNNLVRLNMHTILDIFQPLFSKALEEIILRQFQAVFQTFPLDTLLPEK